MTDLGTQLTLKVSSLASPTNFSSLKSRVSPSDRLVVGGSRVSSPTQISKVLSLGSRVSFKDRVSTLVFQV